MNEWILSSPQFQLLVVLFSTPFALTVALFGMLSSADVQLLRASFVRKKRAVIVPGQQGKVADAGDVTRGAAVIKYACKPALDLFFALSLLSVYIRSARMRMGFAELPKAAAIEEQGNITPLLARSSSLNSLHT